MMRLSRHECLVRSLAMVLISTLACDPTPRPSSDRVRTGNALKQRGETMTQDRSALRADTQKQLPRTVSEWRAVSNDLTVDRARSTTFSVDAPDRWLIQGDTLAVGFDRPLGTLRILVLGTPNVRIFGRRGTGPMEFSSSTTLTDWSADSVLLLDAGQRRGSVVNIANGHGRTFAYSGIDSLGRGDLIGKIGRAGLVFRAYSNNSERGEPGLFRYDGIFRVLDEVSGTERFRAGFRGAAAIRARVGNGRMLSDAPLSLAPLLAAAPDRFQWITGGTDSLYAIDEDAIVPARRLAIPMTELGAQDRARLVSTFLARFKAAPPEVAIALRPHLNVPSRVSSAGALVAGKDRTLWIGLDDVATPRIGGRVWLQLRRDLTVARCVRVKPSQQIVSFGRAIALLATEDPDDGTYTIGVMRLPASCAVAQAPLERE